MLRPWTVRIVLNRRNGMGLSLQIARAIIEEIRSGRLARGTALPGSRALAEHLGVSRKTAVEAYEELTSQGWVVSEPTRGTFVSSSLPAIEEVEDAGPSSVPGLPPEPSVRSRRAVPALAPLLPGPDILTLDDGLPDARLLPADLLSRAYRRMLRDAARGNRLHYGDPRGTLALREAIASMLRQERGIACAADNVCLVRGSQMGIYLAARILAVPGDTVAVERLSYPPAREAFRSAGAEIATIELDADGLVLDSLEALCRRRKVRAVYVTPHHQFPTTVTLRPERRLHLLALAEQFGFAIVEDDYDHEFHFDGKPMLPLITADRWGRVIYIGSLSKLLSPNLRVGYMVAPASVIAQAAAEVMTIDRQGDTAMELALAELMQSGAVTSHVRRVMRVYAARRLAFARLLGEMCADSLSFTLPSGGLALWVRFASSVDPDRLVASALRKKLAFLPGRIFATPEAAVAGARFGFASLDLAELRNAVERLSAAVRD